MAEKQVDEEWLPEYRRNSLFGQSMQSLWLLLCCFFYNKEFFFFVTMGVTHFSGFSSDIFNAN
jgi:hypothetical protein